MELLVFGVSHIHWRRINDHVKILQASEINKHVYYLCMLISRLIGVMSRLGYILVD